MKSNLLRNMDATDSQSLVIVSMLVLLVLFLLSTVQQIWDHQFLKILEMVIGFLIL